MDTETVDFGALLDGAALIVERVPFGSGAAAFDVDIRRVDKRTLEEIGRRSTEVVKVHGRPESKANVGVFRQQLRDHCLAGWHGLTVGKLATACNRRVTEGADTPVPYTPNNALLVLERARGTVNGETVGFDDFVFQQATRIGQEQAQAEADAKNA